MKLHMLNREAVTKTQSENFTALSRESMNQVVGGGRAYLIAYQEAGAYVAAYNQ